MTNTLVSMGAETGQGADIIQQFKDLLNSLIPPTQLGTTTLQSLSNKRFPQPLVQILTTLAGVVPKISRALADIQTTSSTAEIEAVWWSDGFEIYAGQAAPKHVTGFGSLFGHQARVELDGVTYGNYFPLPYCLTFTGFVNPVGPTFEEMRGAVQLNPDGTATGLFCERANRDKDKPDTVPYSGQDGGGYIFKYSASGKPSK